MRGKVLAWVVGSDSRHLLFLERRTGKHEGMEELSIFVDESGRFQHPDPSSRFYILGMVFHDQSNDISSLVSDLARLESEIGIENHCFHAGPLIRKEKMFSSFRREWRAKVFKLLFDFARRVDFKYHCLCVDKRYISSAPQIVTILQTDLASFLNSNKLQIQKHVRIKVYYDCGQSPVTNLLHKAFTAEIGGMVEFAQNVKPQDYKLFQVADLLCTMALIEHKLLNGEHMTESEHAFFGGPRLFKRNILKYLKRKEI